MCGRYTRYVDYTAYHAALREFLEATGSELEEPSEPIAPRYNQPPTDLAPIIIRTGERKLKTGMARWDFVPFFFKQPLEAKKWPSFNARIEEVTEKPAFREAIKTQRCLIPNNGFFEWKKDGDLKTPYWIKPTDIEVAFFGGIWDKWKGTHKGEPKSFYSFAVLTCEPNSLVAPIHNRMPVIIRPEDYATWMYGDVPDAIKIAKEPYPAQVMSATRIGAAVGSVKNDTPDVLTAV